MIERTVAVASLCRNYDHRGRVAVAADAAVNGTGILCISQVLINIDICIMLWNGSTAESQ